jgi:hypothetical protein
MRLVNYVKAIPKTVKRGACVLGLVALTAFPINGLEQNLGNLTSSNLSTPSKSIQIGGTLGFPHLVSLRGVYGWDKKVGFQADISPFFISADVRLRHEEYSAGPWNVYGFLGGIVLNPLMLFFGEPDSPTAGINFGAGVELGKQEGFYVGGEFGLVLFPSDESDGTVGMRMNLNAGYRF